ncbi:IS4/Tn5 family transposase DNA-binding protein [Pseudanabaena catenata]
MSEIFKSGSELKRAYEFRQSENRI